MKYKICVSGAAAGDCINDETLLKAEKVGEAIAESGNILVTGATIGVPNASAKGAKAKGGVSIGFSPGATIWDHTRRYKLPTENMDLIVYTGFGYAGRNLILTRSADAVVIVCGRIGTLNEFTIAFEDKKPIGVLEDSGGMAEELKTITEIAHRHKCRIIYEKDPKVLIEKLVAEIDREYQELESDLNDQEIVQKVPGASIYPEVIE